MDKEKLVQRLMATFLGELQEHVRSLNRDLLALEKERTPEARADVLKALFRTVHTLKGASRSVGVGPIEVACHGLEGVIADIRDGLLSVRPELFELLFATVDGIEEIGVRLRDQREVSDAPLLTLLPGLARAPRARGAAAPVRERRSGAKAPPAPPATFAPAQRSDAAAPPIAQDGNVPGTGGHPMVRIPASKLDALLAASGELLVARRRLEPRADELATLLEFLARWREDWRKAQRPLRRALGMNGPQDGSLRPVLSHRAARPFDQVAENLERTERALDTLLSNLVADRRAVERAAGPLEEEVRRVRMVPFGEACEGLERAARDIARGLGKEVELVLEGGDIELDRSVLGALKDPLLHLVRNAVDHGIEPPSIRDAAGKPACGRVTVGAVLHGDRVRIAVSDDGGGLDVNAIREVVTRSQLSLPAEAHEAAQVIFQPGFSTARAVSEISGRGMGLDIVKSRVESLHGSVVCSAESGRGLSVVLDVPLTLTTVRAILISVSGHVHAIPETHVQNLVRLAAEDVRLVEGREVVTLGAAPVPLVSMAEILGCPPREAPRAGAKIPVVVLSVGEHRAAFWVEELLAERDLMVTNLGPRLRRVRHFSGATLLPSGRIALILNAADLLRSALREAPEKRIAGELAAKTDVSKRLLVVDDSVTTRTLVKSILEAAGYTVLTAPDGASAWEILQEREADLVVADVEMPRMDGCDLTRAIRKSPRFRKLPVVLVTALDSVQDKARGMEAGADAYLVKSAFDQTQLLQTIAQLV